MDRLLPYTAEQLFDLAADVESYPEFLPLWISARIRKRDGNEYHTDQVLGLGPFRIEFGSRTVLQRPSRIDVTSTDFPFRRFRMTWTFEPQPDAACKVTGFSDFELRLSVFQGIYDQVLPNTIGDIMAAFEKRAARLYARSV
ncbi:MAG: type II toxin-antitoxin system RatA family toxin [Bradyrhizobium sp.]